MCQRSSRARRVPGAERAGAEEELNSELVGTARRACWPQQGLWVYSVKDRKAVDGSQLRSPVIGFLR